nr:hypothetical protein [uncultured Methanoregula sp.]
MDKKAVMYGILALVILLIIALVIKPIATGQPVNIGLPSSATPVPTPLIPLNPSGTAGTNGVPVTPLQSLSQTPVSTTVSTPVPTWNAKVKDVGFVDPSTYGLSTNQTYANSTRIDSVSPVVNMTTYATFSGALSGTTQIMYIPFPYWELWYTVDPQPERKTTQVSITPTLGSGASASGVSGSYTTVKPQFTLQVMDANDPNRIVRVISPPGGIDLNLWMGITPTTPANSILKQRPTAAQTLDPKTLDPRPWKEKFFEGQKDYYFIINSQNLKSYKIDIKVPTKYIGQF